MKSVHTNWILMAIVGGAFGVAMLVGPRLANASPYYYQSTAMKADLRYDSKNCSAMCGNTKFEGTTWRSSSNSRVVYSQLPDPTESHGLSAHVRAHAGCRKSSSDRTLVIGAWSQLDESVTATCPSDRTLTGYDCEIEVQEACKNL